MPQVNFGPLRRAAEILANAYIQSKALAASSHALRIPETMLPPLPDASATLAAHSCAAGLEMMRSSEVLQRGSSS